LIGTRGFSDKDDIGIGVSDAEHKLRAGLTKRAFHTITDGRVEIIETCRRYPLFSRICRQRYAWRRGQAEQVRSVLDGRRFLVWCHGGDLLLRYGGDRVGKKHVTRKFFLLNERALNIAQQLMKFVVDVRHSVEKTAVRKKKDAVFFATSTTCGGQPHPILG
ncbi:MAG TPA: hypothetical protein DEP53_19955, partial [Bacteroidetes bacterium]|nr:hypothetical protein [Bacteroidota bacterium]